jgi:hypothetical protein
MYRQRKETAADYYFSLASPNKATHPNKRNGALMASSDPRDYVLVGSVEIRYCATKNRHHWQPLGSAPTPANGAACATPGVVATTETGASAMAAAAAMPSAFISLQCPIVAASRGDRRG